MEELKRLIEQFQAETRASVSGDKTKLAQLERQLRELETRANGLGATGSGFVGGASDGDVRAGLAEFVRTGSPDLLTKTFQIGVAADGGVTVPSELAKAIESVAFNRGVVRKLARVVQARSSEYEQIVASSGMAAEWVAETGTRSDQTTPTLKSVKPPGGAISSIAPVTNWSLQDSAYDVATFVIEMIGKSFAVSEGAAFVSGNGTNRPKGILSHTLAATSDATRTWGELEKLHSGTSGAFDLDDVLDLIDKLNPEYRANASFLMHPSTATYLRKLKASTAGTYHWEPAVSKGQPPTLWGFPVYLDVNMPVVAASANVLIFGDFNAGYVIADIGSPTMIVDKLTTKGITKVWMERRVAGTVLDSNSLKVLSLQV